MAEEKVAPKKPAMVHVKNNGIRHRLIHPEHGNHGFPARAVCAVVYQRNLDAEERAQRVAD